MENKKGRLISLRDIEGKISPHQGQVDRALKARAEALNFVEDVQELADFMGGQKEDLGYREDWAISKEVFPGIKIYYVFTRSDDEFPAALRVLFEGERLNLVSGEDLASIIIPTVSHMLRYVREANPGKELPEVCYRV